MSLKLMYCSPRSNLDSGTAAWELTSPVFRENFVGCSAGNAIDVSKRHRRTTTLIVNGFISVVPFVIAFVIFVFCALEIEKVVY